MAYLRQLYNVAHWAEQARRYLLHNKRKFVIRSTLHVSNEPA